MPGKDHLLDYGNFIKSFLKGLANLYQTADQIRLPLLGTHMRAIKGVMSLQYIDDVTLWALWLAQWQGAMCGSYIVSNRSKIATLGSQERNTHRAI